MFSDTQTQDIKRNIKRYTKTLYKCASVEAMAEFVCTTLMGYKESVVTILPLARSVEAVSLEDVKRGHAHCLFGSIYRHMTLSDMIPSTVNGWSKLDHDERQRRMELCLSFFNIAAHQYTRLGRTSTFHHKIADYYYAAIKTSEDAPEAQN